MKRAYMDHAAATPVRPEVMGSYAAFLCRTVRQSLGGLRPWI